MPSSVALVLTALFIGALLWHDTRRQDPPVTAALWVPIVWVLLVSSKFVGQWLALFGLTGGAPVSIEDGSPLDAVVFLALILLGVAILCRRRVDLRRIIVDNRLLTALFLYTFVSIAWSDFPLVAARRWIKALGHPVMALVVLSERHPVESLRRLIKRTGFVYVPLSVLCIKYYPWIGRGFDHWSGAPINRGISNNKNELGYACLFFGLGFFWNLLCARRADRPRLRDEILVSVVFLGLVAWLLMRADSATSLATLMLGVSIIVALGLPFVDTKHAWAYVLLTLCAALAVEGLFGVSERIFVLLGRDATLTDRTEVWADLMAIDINPILGAGFESFWLGPRLEAMWDRWWWQPNQAHNGYIETYLNLGWVGLALLLGVVVATFVKAQHDLERNYELGLFRMAWLLVIVAYNYTEATFKGVHLFWTVFHIIAIGSVTTWPAARGHPMRRAKLRPMARDRDRLGRSAPTDTPTPDARVDA